MALYDHSLQVSTSKEV